MSEAINILILSCGTRNKIVQYFRRELAGKGLVIAADCSLLAPALYEADRHVIVPSIKEDGYIDAVLSVCREHKIKAVLSWLDPELVLLAENKERFLEQGVLPLVPDRGQVEQHLNKYKFYEYLKESGYPTIQTFLDKAHFYQSLEKGEISLPVFVKPVRGSGSVHASKAATVEEIELMFSREPDLIIQEYMDGTQYDADVYVDMITGEPVSIFIKEKLRMRAGEADKAVSVRDEVLSDLLFEYVKRSGLTGMLDIDVFKQDGQYYILEVNPRFGGGYPHAHECGVNGVGMIISNLEGRANEDQIGRYEADVYMLKYSELKMIRGGKELS